MHSGDLFQTHKRGSTYFAVVAGLIMWAAMVLLFTLTQPWDRSLVQWPMIFPLLLLVLFGFILWMSLFKLLITYRLTARGILITDPPFRKTLLPYQEIRQAELLSGDATRSLFMKFIREHNEIVETSDLSRYFTTIKQNTPSFRYFTISPALLTTRFGEKDRLNPVAMEQPGAVIRLVLTTGEFLYLSPRAPQKFHNQLEQRLADRKAEEDQP